MFLEQVHKKRYNRSLAFVGNKSGLAHLPKMKKSSRKKIFLFYIAEIRVLNKQGILYFWSRVLDPRQILKKET